MVKIKRTNLTSKKNSIVELWQQTHGHISNICRAVGISRDTFYRWLEEDPKFRVQVEQAEAELNDDMREILINKAGEGSTAELIFYLKMRHPDFKETRGNVNVQVNVAPILGGKTADVHSNNSD